MIFLKAILLSFISDELNNEDIITGNSTEKKIKFRL